MRHVLALIGILTLGACADGGSPTEIDRGAPSARLPRKSESTAEVLPATTFTRATGTPRTDAVSFEVPTGTVATLHLSSASPQGLDATVYAGNTVIFTSVDGAGLPASIPANDGSTTVSISVKLRGKPGSSITLSATIPVGVDRSILFSSDRETPGIHQIYAMALDGSNVARLTFSTTANDFNPRWSPDKSRIAFSSERNGGRHIWIMEPDGSNPVQCTVGGSFNDTPDWYPDGSRIAFVSKRDGYNQLYTVNSDCTNETRISNGAFSDYDPAISPDGSRVLFTRITSFSMQDVWVMNIDGTGASALTSNAGINYTPRWSSDGSMIAFTSDRSGGQNVWTMSATGANPTQLTAAPTSYRPVFYPDDSRIVFASARTGVYQLYSMTLTGANVTQLTNPPTGESYSPDVR